MSQKLFAIYSLNWSALMALDRAKLDRMIAKADAWLTQREQEQAACQDAEDGKLEEDLSHGNTMPVAPSAPFSDGAPQRIHGEPSKKDVFG
jgi:hypothetical protein